MRIVFVGPEEGLAAARNEIAGRADVVFTLANADSLSQALAEADALIDASMKVRITDAMIMAAPRLKIISTATTGSDHIDRRVANERSIQVRTLREDGDLLREITPAAELTWALVLACARRLVPAVEHVRAGGWNRELFPGVTLKRRELGIIGCGRIGQEIAGYAHAFGMRVMGFDPYLDPWPGNITRRDLSQLVAEADVISVHVHLSDETRNLIDSDLFGRMKAGAIFINTSRGAIADERALVRSLESGQLAAAGVDVLDGEPDIGDHPLVDYARTHDNLLITPHCGGFSPDAVKLVCARAAAKVAAELRLG